MDFIQPKIIGSALLACAAIAVAGSAVAGNADGLRRAEPAPLLKGDIADYLAPERPLRGGGVCGDSSPDAGEECDDGNTANGDGCSSTCTIEAGFECTDAIAATTGTNVVADPSFEAGTPSPSWVETSTNFGTVLCTTGLCGGPGGTDGEWFAWFGGIGVFEEGTLSQSVTIPDTATTLSFDLLVGVCDDPGSTADFLEVRIDGNLLYTTAPCTENGAYETIDVGIAAFADNGPHTLLLTSQTVAANLGPTNFFVDNLMLTDNLGGDPPVPSMCAALGEQCYAEDFDAEAGDLTGWTLFNVGALGADWGLSDDGFCFGPTGSIGIPANVTGGSGEAACIDSDASGFGQIDAYLCSPEVDLSAASAPTLRFKYNYQIFGAADAGDFFEVLEGTDAPSAATIGGYSTIFSTNQNAGALADVPGETAGTFGSIPLTAQTGHLCYRYGGDFDWYAQVDDIDVRASSCGPTGDSDGDGVPDAVDNCIDIANPPQEDTDGDGHGNECDADINNDCTVNFVDLGLLKAAFTPGPYSADADLVFDGFVNFLDLGRMKQTFFNGATPGPGSSAPPNLCGNLP